MKMGIIIGYCKLYTAIFHKEYAKYGKIDWEEFEKVLVAKFGKVDYN